MENTEMTYEQRHAKEYEKVSRSVTAWGIRPVMWSMDFAVRCLHFSILIM